MSKKIVAGLISLSLLVLPLAALAYDVQDEPDQTDIDVQGLISKIVQVVWWVFAAIAVIMFVYAGVTFLLAQGDPEKIKVARSAAIWGSVGVVVMILAFSIFTIASNWMS